MADTLIYLDNTRKMSVECFLILSDNAISFFMDLPTAELIKLAKMEGVIQDADYAYPI